MLMFKTGKITKDFHKPIIHNIYCLVVTVYISENNFQTIAIIPFIKAFLVLGVVLDAAVDDGVQCIQICFLTGKYEALRKGLPVSKNSSLKVKILR